MDTQMILFLTVRSRIRQFKQKTIRVFRVNKSNPVGTFVHLSDNFETLSLQRSYQIFKFFAEYGDVMKAPS